MISDITSVIFEVIGAIGDFLTPTVGAEGSLMTAAAVAAIAVLFASPIAIKTVRKAIGLIKALGK